MITNVPYAISGTAVTYQPDQAGQTRTFVINGNSNASLFASDPMVDGTPGLKRLVVTVNKARPQTYPLKSGQVWEADLATRMQPDTGNAIKLVVRQGKFDGCSGKSVNG